MTDHLPEIREAEAPPETAALYSDIKTVTGLPQVNLIYRHLATRPGILEWVWGTLRPLYASEEFAAAATGLAEAIPPAGEAAPIADILSGPDLAAYRDVIAVYNSGNAQNLIGLTAFVTLLDGTPAATAEHLTPRSQANTSADTPTAEFPPIPRRDRLDAETTDRLERLAARHRTAPGVVPSLYVHIALWPQILPAVDRFLAPRLEDPGWQPTVTKVTDRATAAARRLAANLSGDIPPGLDEATRREMATTIRTFVNATIPEMVVVGGWLARDTATM